MGHVSERTVEEDIMYMELELKILEQCLDNLNESIQYYFKGE